MSKLSFRSSDRSFLAWVQEFYEKARNSKSILRTLHTGRFRRDVLLARIITPRPQIDNLCRFNLGRPISMAFQFPSILINHKDAVNSSCLRILNKLVMENVYCDCYLLMNWLAPSTELRLFRLLRLAQFTPSV